MKLDPLLDDLRPDIQCVRTHWNRGFMGFQLAQLTRTAMPEVPM